MFPTKILGRDPVLVLAFVAVVLQLISRFIPFTVDQQALVLAVLAALIGAIGAFVVKSDRAVPLLVGLVKAVLALLLGFKLNLDPDLQATILAFVTTGAALWTYGKVTAPVDVTGQAVAPTPYVAPAITKSTGQPYS